MTTDRRLALLLRDLRAALDVPEASTRATVDYLTREIERLPGRRAVQEKGQPF
jgi:hypothetical protein